jgi:hypothetical protein
LPKHSLEAKLQQARQREKQKLRRLLAEEKQKEWMVIQVQATQVQVLPAAQEALLEE